MFQIGLIAFLAVVSVVLSATATVEQPYYLQQCSPDEEVIDQCLLENGNRLIYHLRHGIPELDILDIEPVIIDEIGIVLGSGPDGYRAVFSNIQAFGVGNMTVSNVRSDIASMQFQITCEIPRIQVKAQYKSSGVLILVRASGAGDYWGEYEGVKAKIYFKAKPELGDDELTYLSVQDVKMDFSVKDIKMGVNNIANGNAVIQAALNLFINSNAQELLREMKPSLREKLINVIHNFMDRLFAKMPLEQWMTDASE